MTNCKISSPTAHFRFEKVNESTRGRNSRIETAYISEVPSKKARDTQQDLNRPQLRLVGGSWLPGAASAALCVSQSGVPLNTLRRHRDDEVKGLGFRVSGIGFEGFRGLGV